MSAKFATVEVGRLKGVSRALSQLTSGFGGRKSEAKFQFLEAAACRMGSHNLSAYFEAFGCARIAEFETLEGSAADIISLIDQTGIAPALVLSALAREELSASDQRATGAYHTDFRLAQRLARSIAMELSPESRVIDPACGAGILLVALTLEVCGHDRRATAQFLRNGMYAADLSSVPLRGARLALASLTDDLGAVIEMCQHWIAGDSLLLAPEKWHQIAPGGFDAVIANPPWERVRLTRHEFARGGGSRAHYGSAIAAEHLCGFHAKQKKIATYAERLAQRHPLLTGGEADLYAAFMSLYLEQLRPGGRAAVLVPGGLIRSQGTAAIRRALFASCDQIEVGIFDNKARFFAIDTRFKFVALTLRRGTSDDTKGAPIRLTHEVGTAQGTDVSGRARLSRTHVSRLSPDLSLPEVASDHAWRLFRRLGLGGERMDDPRSAWYAEPCRELDMTSDRAAFSQRRGKGLIPVIEGRHIHQFRFGAKTYRSGSGRAAVWDALPFGSSDIRAQFHIAPSRCADKARQRMGLWRVGFCDIAGQTNERAMMAALVPPGVACGNKVPTVVFPNDTSAERLRVWTAIANSFAFDWMLRRVLTTTINYFLLYSVPMPRLHSGGLPWRRIVRAVDALAGLDAGGRAWDTDRAAAELRIQIEMEVCLAYDLSVEDLDLMLDDFPLLDRGQPALQGEMRSTVTRDTVLSAFARRRRERDEWRDRASAAAARGAVPYVPAQMADRAQTDYGVAGGGSDVEDWGKGR
ncbi:MAG: SAM-dependent methyltransferase [Pseudomonadota bacterium]|nr:SAM-dependent methyltransferase [Pseudomonadota bacterium]